MASPARPHPLGWGGRRHPHPDRDPELSAFPPHITEPLLYPPPYLPLESLAPCTLVELRRAEHPESHTTQPRRVPAAFFSPLITADHCLFAHLLTQSDCHQEEPPRPPRVTLSLAGSLLSAGAAALAAPCRNHYPRCNTARFLWVPLLLRGVMGKECCVQFN